MGQTVFKTKKMKNIALQRYNSTYGFVRINNLEKEADDFFGKNWEAEDDVQQITDLLTFINRKDLTVSFIEGLQEDDILVSEFHKNKLSQKEFLTLKNKIYNDLVSCGVISDESENSEAFSNVLGSYLLKN